MPSSDRRKIDRYYWTLIVEGRDHMGTWEHPLPLVYLAAGLTLSAASLNERNETSKESLHHELKGGGREFQAQGTAEEEGRNFPKEQGTFGR